MTKKYKAMAKVLSILLCITLLFAYVPMAAIVNAAAAKVDTRVVDPSTINDWKNFFGEDVMNTENAGGIWTDKSVFTDASQLGGDINMDEPDDNFLIAMSAIAANKSITGYSHIPTDTILVLDISRSMGPNTEQGDKNNDAVDELVESANAAIKKLQEVNNYNRVGVVLYSGNYTSTQVATNSHSTVLLPLGRYEHRNNEFLVKDRHTFKVNNNNVTAESVMVNSGVTTGGSAVAQTEKEVYGGTYIQGGIHTAMREFLNVEDTTIEGDGFQAGTKRIPITVLMSDGLPTIATNNYTGNSNGIGNSNMGDGGDPQNELKTAIPFVTQLTASYAKERIEEHYERDSLFYTLGFKIEDSPVLDPDNTTVTDTHWSTYNNTAPNGTMQLAVGREWVDEGFFDPGHYETIYAPITKSNYNLTESYVNQYFQADESLTAAFDAIVDEIILQSLYYPTQVNDGNNDLDGYIEFIDDIGQFMEVKDVKGILLGNILFNGDNIAKNFIGGGGELGTIDNPSTLGDEMIRAVKARLGIADTAEAQKLVDDAYHAGQLAYDPVTGDYSNYIGWYADANGNYLGHGTRDDSKPMEGAVFYNESYGYLGEVIDGHKNSDMMYVSVQVHTRIATGTSAVIFRVPASLIPVVSYNVSLTGTSISEPGEITLDLDNTMDIDTDGDGDYDIQEPVAPIRLVYEVGLKDEINELTVAEIVGKDYKYYNDGEYTFYTNRWNPDDLNHEHPSVAENTVAFYEPNVENERYYYAENSTVYRQVGGEYVPYTGAQSPAYATEPLYRQYAVFEQVNNNRQNNAEVHLRYEQMSPEALGVAKANTEDDNAPTADTTWYVPKGTIHRMFENFHTGKGGFTDSTQTAVNANNTDTLIYSHYLGVELIPDNAATEEQDANYYADVVLGNNGKMTVEAAQGIKITKALDTTMTDRTDEEFTFVVAARNELEPQGEYRLVKIDTEGVMTTTAVDFRNGEEEVELKAGETAYFLDLPAGVTYTVSEDCYGKDYQVASINGEELDQLTVTVEENVISSAEFLNTLTPPDTYGTLTVQKLIEHPFGANYTAPENLEFSFEVDFYNETDGTHDTKEFVLGPNETKMFTEIPMWTTVTVKEVNIPAGFASDKENDTEVVVIEDTKNYVVTFNNTYTPDSVNPNITLAGSKSFTGRAGDEWLDTDSFTFKLQKRVGTEWTDMTLTDDIGTVHKAEATVTKDNKTFDFSNFINAETYTERGTYAYRVVEVFDENPYKGITFDESVRWMFIEVDDTDMDGSLEIANVSGYGGTVVEGNAEDAAWNVETTFYNTYAAEGSDAITININKSILDNSVEDQADSLVSKAGFEFGLYQNGNLVQTFPATSEAGDTLLTLSYGAADIGNNIHYTISEIVPEQPIAGMKYSTQQYNVVVTVADDTVGGVIATASVIENVAGALPATGDEVAVEFTNTYDPAPTTAYISGIKTLVGREITDGEFTFELYKANSEFEAISEPEIAVNNGTEFTFGELAFNKPGEYYYVVKEQAGSDENMTYDNTEYMVIVKVTDIGGELAAEVLVNGEAEGYVNFTNTYEPPTEPTTVQTDPTEPSSTAPIKTDPTEPSSTAPVKTDPTEPSSTVPVKTDPTEPSSTAPIKTDPTEPSTTAPAGTEPTTIPAPPATNPAPVDPPASNTPAGTPQTGDGTDVLTWFACLYVISGGIIGVEIFKKKKAKYNTNK